MSKRIDKHELKGPDMFVSTSDKVMTFIEHHSKTFLSIILVVAVAAIGYTTKNYLEARHEQKAAEALYAPEAALKKAEADIREERAKKMQDVATGKTKKKDEAKKKEDDIRPVDYAKDYAPLVEKLKETIKANANTKASMVSALNLSYFLAQQKQYAEALAVLDLPGYTPDSKGLLGGFWLMHRGVMQIENQQYEPAIQTYSTVLNSEALKPFQPEALLKLGVAYELKGEAQKARETYERISRDFPETEASSTAQQYLRLLEIKTPQKG